MFISDRPKGGEVRAKERMWETRPWTLIRNFKLNLRCQTVASALSTFKVGVMAKATTSGYRRRFDVFGRYCWRSFAVLALENCERMGS